MKASLKSTLIAIVSLSLLHVNAQTSSNNVSKPMIKRSMTSSGTSVAIGLKNLSDKSVTIYAGPKEDLEKPEARQKVYEARGTNTIYVSINEVVCIMHEGGKPISCADVVPGAAEMEIDGAGNSITVKQ